MNWKTKKDKIENLLNRSKFGLVTDVDGTISPIVDRPDQARVDPGIKATLKSLTGILPLVAVVSGRSAQDVSGRVGIEGIVYIGNHGLERLVGDQVIPNTGVSKYRSALQLAAKELQPLIYPGMMVEDKIATLSVHYRMAENHHQVEEKLLPSISSIANKHGLDLFSGRKVYELRPPIKMDKGSAFRSLVIEHGLEAALYLGDDTTDAAALKETGQLRQEGICQAYGVGVGTDTMPAEVRRYSDWTASGIEDVSELFAFLLNSSKASST